LPFTFGSYVVSEENARRAVLNFDEACLDIYDLGGTSAPNRVEPVDIGRLVASQMVGIKQSAAAEMIRVSDSAPWSKVPVDGRLEDAAPGTPLYANACELLDYFRDIKDVGPAIATKMLAMKRPILFPVIDSRIEKLYNLASRQQLGASHPVLASLHDDTLRPDGIEALHSLRKRLVEIRERKAQKLAQLPGIRLRDIIAWQRWTDLGIGHGKPPAPPEWPGTRAL